MKFLSKRNWIITGTSILLACLMVLSGVQVGRTIEQKGSLTVGFGVPTIRIGMAGVAATGTADYTCSGANDDVVVQTALNALPSNGGKLQFLSGNYSFSSTVTRLIPNVLIEGNGASTIFTFDASTPLFTAGGNSWSFQNFVTDAGGVSFGATLNWTEVNIVSGSQYYAYRAQNANASLNTVNATQVTTTTGNVTTGFITTLNTTTANISQFSNSPAPSVNATHSWGSSILKWLTGWFVNLVADTTNTTQLTATTGNISTLNAPTGRGATIVVALSDASATVKAQADYIVTGNCDDEMQAALNALPLVNGYRRGTVKISGSSGNVSQTINMTGGQAIIGDGMDSTNLTLIAGANTNMFLVGAGVSVTEPAAYIGFMTLDGANSTNSLGSGIRLQSGLGTLISNVKITSFSENGTVIQGASSSIRPDYAKITNSWIVKNKQSGIVGGIWSNAVEIIGNHISDNGAIPSANNSGINLINGAVDYSIVGNMIWQNARANIINNGSQVEIIGNTLASPLYENIWVQRTNGIVINGNSLVEASLAASGAAPSILYGSVGAAANRMVISNNYFVSTSNNESYWITGVGSGGTGAITGNTFSGAPASGNLLLDTTSFIIANNRGSAFRTENSGTTTLVSGTTSIAVTHSLGLTPTRVFVTPTTNLTAAASFWVSGVGATQFTINTNVDPTANITFNWRAAYGEGN